MVEGWYKLKGEVRANGIFCRTYWSRRYHTLWETNKWTPGDVAREDLNNFYKLVVPKEFLRG